MKTKPKGYIEIDDSGRSGMATTLSGLGYSKEQISVLAKAIESETLIVGSVLLEKSPATAKIVKTISSERKFREKRQRRESRSKK
ncbi:hypothetical protein [Undibacterium sp.]|uniref:hypothetical protein n=1 Tax=Undibacterium sp. TaxID=1914977 RepID=UPI0037512165